jgi:hypothetical protein
MGVHLGVWGFIPSHSLHSREHVECSRVSHLARNLVTPCFGREPMARVATKGYIPSIIQSLEHLKRQYMCSMDFEAAKQLTILGNNTRYMLILVARKWSFRSQGHKASQANRSNVLYTNLGQEHCAFPQMHKTRNKATLSMYAWAEKSRFFFLIVIKSQKLHISIDKTLQSPSTTTRAPLPRRPAGPDYWKEIWEWKWGYFSYYAVFLCDSSYGDARHACGITVAPSPLSYSSTAHFFRRVH